jgi:repressor LexA
MGEELTRRQREVLNFIISFARKHGFQPSMREIGEKFGIRSTHGVHRHLQALQKKGYLKRPVGQGRALELRHFAPPRGSLEIPVLAKVAAGEPLLAVENIEETLVVDQSLVKGKDSFFLRVQGESMIGAHILDADYVLVKPQPSAENGDIVVALMEDEATVKRFYKKGKTVQLKPENPAFKAIEVDEKDGRFQIIGKVVGVFRQLAR